MYNKPVRRKGTINRNESVEGETIERTIQRMLNNNESDMTTKDVIYTRPEDGVPYGTDIRGDKWEKAIETTTKVATHVRNSREKKYEKRRKGMEVVKDEAVEEPSVQANSKQAD